MATIPTLEDPGSQSPVTEPSDTGMSQQQVGSEVSPSTGGFPHGTSCRYWENHDLCQPWLVNCGGSLQKGY